MPLVLRFRSAAAAAQVAQRTSTAACGEARGTEHHQESRARLRGKAPCRKGWRLDRSTGRRLHSWVGRGSAESSRSERPVTSCSGSVACSRPSGRPSGRPAGGTRRAAVALPCSSSSGRVPPRSQACRADRDHQTRRPLDQVVVGRRGADEERGDAATSCDVAPTARVPRVRNPGSSKPNRMVPGRLPSASRPRQRRDATRLLRRPSLLYPCRPRRCGYEWWSLGLNVDYYLFSRDKIPAVSHKFVDVCEQCDTRTHLRHLDGRLSHFAGGQTRRCLLCGRIAH